MRISVSVTPVVLAGIELRSTVVAVLPPAAVVAVWPPVVVWPDPATWTPDFCPQATATRATQLTITLKRLALSCLTTGAFTAAPPAPGRGPGALRRAVALQARRVHRAGRPRR